MSERTRAGLTAGVILVLVAVTAAMLVSGRSGGEDRAARLEQQLRCPTCKSVSIAESPSTTAAGMRRIVKSQVAAGRSDEEIIGYFTARYGDWVVMGAPPRGDTLMLWVLVVVVVGTAGAVFATRAGRGRRPATELGPSDRTTVAAALAQYSSRRVDDDDEP